MNWQRWRVKSPLSLVSAFECVCVLYTYLSNVSIRPNLTLMESNHCWISTETSTKVRALTTAKAHGKSAAAKLLSSEALDPQLLQSLCSMTVVYLGQLKVLSCRPVWVLLQRSWVFVDFDKYKVEENPLNCLSLCVYLSSSDRGTDTEMLKF